ASAANSERATDGGGFGGFAGCVSARLGAGGVLGAGTAFGAGAALGGDAALGAVTTGGAGAMLGAGATLGAGASARGTGSGRASGCGGRKACGFGSWSRGSTLRSSAGTRLGALAGAGVRGAGGT